MYNKKLEKERLEKDLYFKINPNSPIKKIHRRKFRKLNYFNIDLNFIFKTSLKEASTKEKINILNSGAYSEQYLIFGELVFNYRTKEYRLFVFQNSNNPDYLWVPFKDLTNGKQTYQAGRYLDLQLSKLNSTFVELDFNRAYNPYCAYNSEFVCPLVPKSNHLVLEIAAGEKKAFLF